MAKKLPTKAVRGTWVQTEREGHEAWAALSRDQPKAAILLHLLAARVGEYNAVVASQETLAELMTCSVRTVKRAVAVLQEHRWIEVRRIGKRGTVNGYVLNNRVIWSGPREGIRYGLFSAHVIVSEREQPAVVDNTDGTLRHAGAAAQDPKNGKTRPAKGPALRVVSTTDFGPGEVGGDAGGDHANRHRKRAAAGGV